MNNNKIEIIASLFCLKDKLNHAHCKDKKNCKFVSISKFARRIKEQKISIKGCNSREQLNKLHDIHHFRNKFIHGEATSNEELKKIKIDISHFKEISPELEVKNYWMPANLSFLAGEISQKIWEAWTEIYSEIKNNYSSPHLLLDVKRKDILKYCNKKIRASCWKVRKKIFSFTDMKEFEEYLEYIMTKDKFFALIGLLYAFKKEILGKIMRKIMDTRFDILLGSEKNSRLKRGKVTTSRFLQIYTEIIFIRNKIIHSERDIPSTMTELLKNNKNYFNPSNEFIKGKKIGEEKTIEITKAKTINTIYIAFKNRTNLKLSVSQIIYCPFLFFFTEEETKKILGM